MKRVSEREREKDQQHIHSLTHSHIQMPTHLDAKQYFICGHCKGIHIHFKPVCLMCVCVCVCEREREREKNQLDGHERERERE